MHVAPAWTKCADGCGQEQQLRCHARPSWFAKYKVGAAFEALRYCSMSGIGRLQFVLFSVPSLDLFMSGKSL